MKKITVLLLLMLFMQQNVDAQRMINLSTGATMAVYTPSSSIAKGKAIIICPGGGYSYLSTANEGTDWAAPLVSEGYLVGVLSYRMPNKVADRPLKDTEAAIRYIRGKGSKWHINDGCVGIMGFSAGGHVASTLATHFSDDTRPDFQVLFYPVITMDPSYTHMGSHDNLLGADASAELEELYSNEKQVKANTPPAFITYAANDGTVPTNNSKNYANALKEKDIPVYVKEYPTGGHGFGFKETFAYHDDVVSELINWLNKLDEILPTGISSIHQDNHEPSTSVYRLDGRKVKTAFDTLPHGIYIKDGKKVMKQ